MSVVNLIKSDLFRYYGATNNKTMYKALVKSRYFRFQVFFRLCSSNVFFVRAVFKYLKMIAGKNVNVQIHHSVSIGPGLYIPHGNVVVNSTAEIGSNCSLMQFTSIGSIRGKAAIIQDNVYIGPNACIVEDVTIGSCSVVGAGSVVTKDVAVNTIVAGVPAKRINSVIDINSFIYNKYS